MDKYNHIAKKKKVKRLSGPLNTGITTVSSNSVNANSYYYPSNYISKPCDQLFGPQPFEPAMTSLDSTENESLSDSFSTNHIEKANNSFNEDANEENFEYIPAPKWNKLQNSILEELYKKTRYPKPHELKMCAQRFNVMDCDIEEWFRKRRGRDRRTKRKNETLKSMIDNYIEMKCWISRMLYTHIAYIKWDMNIFYFWVD